jgi:hypothetical protein
LYYIVVSDQGDGDARRNKLDARFAAGSI